MSLLVRDRAQRRQVSRRIVRFAFRSFIAQMRVMGIYTYELRNIERLQRGGLLIIANHPTLIDVVFLMAFVRNADCVVKAALWRNPFMRGPIRAADYVSNGTGPDMVDACIEAIRKGGNLILFPEGTRSVPGRAFAFQRGASNIAVRGALALTPVYIECKPVMLTKGEKWYRVPDRAPHFVISVGEDIPVAPYLQSGLPLALGARRLTQDLEQHYTQELARHG
ncbi:lysophospholipid acyltransferase family protein [Niveibacterium sp. 24ML]|uniref:lysophospholipid acyltransferase family protein n=1 Tax=Niveibacterium sp. 24ML TaxID=2985512 RepID=UPI00226E82E7|nr:lysophospholipid acyltransferase family protein [Niveibacterium sp. 24ML]